MSSFRKAGTGPRAAPAGASAAAPGSVGAANPSASAASASSSIASREEAADTASVSSGYLPCGTRRWVDGRLLVSSGIPTLDAFLGGGQPLGGLVLLEEDYEAAQANAMTALFLAEGIACGQSILLCGNDSTAALARQLARLPMNVSRDSRDLAAAAAAGATSSKDNKEGLGGATEEVGTADDEERGGTDGEPTSAGAGWDVSGAGLKIAWQYKKYLPQGKSSEEGVTVSDKAPSTSTGPRGAPSVPIIKFGHTFDLSRRIHPTVLAEHAPRTAVLSLLELFEAVDGTVGAAAPPTKALPALVTDALRAAATAATVPPASPVLRLVLQGLGAAWDGLPTAADQSLGVLQGVDALPPATGPSGFSARALLQTLARLRSWVHGAAAPVQRGSALQAPAIIVLASMPTHAMSPELAGQVRSYFDAVLKVRAFTDPAEGVLPSNGAGTAAAGFNCAALSHVQPRSSTASLLASSLRSSSGAPPPEFKDFTGLIALRRLPRMGPSLTPQFQPDTATLLFKRDRKKFVVEKPSLPPGGDDPAAQPAVSPAPASGNKVATAVARLSATGSAASSARAATLGTSNSGGSGDGPTFGVNPDTDEVDAHLPSGPLAGDGSGAVLAMGGGSSCSAAPGPRRGLMDRAPGPSPLDF